MNFSWKSSPETHSNALMLCIFHLVSEAVLQYVLYYNYSITLIENGAISCIVLARFQLL